MYPHSSTEDFKVVARAATQRWKCVSKKAPYDTERVEADVWLTPNTHNSVIGTLRGLCKKAPQDGGGEQEGHRCAP
jgi:hypothetical protein